MSEEQSSVCKVLCTECKYHKPPRRELYADIEGLHFCTKNEVEKMNCITGKPYSFGLRSCWSSNADGQCEDFDPRPIGEAMGQKRRWYKKWLNNP